jgi:hypothetical protein
MRRHSLDVSISHTYTHTGSESKHLNSLSLHTMSSATNTLQDILSRIDLQGPLTATSLMHQQPNAPRTDKAVFRVSEFALGNTDGKRVTFYPVSSLT